MKQMILVYVVYSTQDEYILMLYVVPVYRTVPIDSNLVIHQVAQFYSSGVFSDVCSEC